MGVIDNFAKRIKTILTKTFLQLNTTKWTDKLEKIIKIYNRTPNKAIHNKTPEQATLPQNEQEIVDMSIDKNKENKMKIILMIWKMTMTRTIAET